MGIEFFHTLQSFIISLIDFDPIVGLSVFYRDQEQHQTTGYILYIA